MSRRLEPSPDPGRFGATVLLSLALHVAGFTLAVALPRLMPRGASGPPVYVVDLVAPPEGGAPGGEPAPPAPPAPPRPKIAPPPRPEKAIKLPAKDAKKKPQAKKPEPKTKPTPAPAATPHAAAAAAGAPATADTTAEGAAGAGAGSGRAGGPGGTGTGTGDLEDFYRSLLKRRIDETWQRFKPIYPPTETSRHPITATVQITLTSSGRVTETRLIAPSGYQAMDQSVLRAISEAQPLPPFPFQLGRETMTVRFEIQLNP